MAIVYDRPIYRSGNLVKKMYRSGELIYYRLNPHNEEPEPEPEYDKIPFTFKVLSAGTISWKASGALARYTIEYSKNSGSTWTSIKSSTGRTSISVNAGDTVQFRGDNNRYGASSSRYSSFNGSTAKFEVEGNIMSLIDSTGFTTATTLSAEYTFYSLFGGCTGLTSAKNLVLPATTLDNYCYENMFSGCTSLTQAPALPATTLKNYCYHQMFYNCTLLNHIKCLATNISASNCTTNWVSGVASTGTFVKNPNMTGWTRGNNGIPTNWTVANA